MSLSRRQVTTDKASAKSKQPVAKRVAAGVNKVLVLAANRSGRVTAKSR